MLLHSVVDIQCAQFKWTGNYSGCTAAAAVEAVDSNRFVLIKGRVATVVAGLVALCSGVNEFFCWVP